MVCNDVNIDVYEIFIVWLIGDNFGLGVVN